MRLLAAALVVLGTAGVASADARECLPVTPRNPDGNYIVPGALGDVVYRRVGGTGLALDVSGPAKGRARPLVVVVHGGGWKAGSRTAFVGQFIEMLARKGYAWASIDYRLDRTAAVEDVREALAFLRCHARALAIDPDRVAILGEDAGAHLAAQIGAEPKSGVRAIALVGGLYDARLAPLRPGATAALVVHGSADTETTIESASAWCAASRAAGGRCDLVAVEGGIHRPENWRPSQWGYKGRLIEWLSEALDGRPRLKPGATANRSKPGATANRSKPGATANRSKPGAPNVAPGFPSARLRAGSRGPESSRGLLKDIVFDTKTGLTLDAFLPAGKGPFPAVIIAHGGGWEAGDKVTYVTPIFEPLARAGFAWFSIDYRLTPDVDHAAQLDDLRRAIAFVRERAPEFRVDPRRIAILGESASGQMVAQVATEDRNLAAVVSFYGVYDFAPMVTDASPRSLLARLFRRTALDEDARAVLRKYSPIEHVHRDMPPLLMIHGTSERLWQQGLAMQKRLGEVGARHELYAVENAPHGMENWEGHPEWAGYKQKLVSWLRDRFR